METVNLVEVEETPTVDVAVVTIDKDLTEETRVVVENLRGMTLDESQLNRLNLRLNPYGKKLESLLLSSHLLCLKPCKFPVREMPRDSSGCTAW